MRRKLLPTSGSIQYSHSARMNCTMTIAKWSQLPLSVMMLQLRTTHCQEQGRMTTAFKTTVFKLVEENSPETEMLNLLNLACMPKLSTEATITPCISQLWNMNRTTRAKPTRSTSLRKNSIRFHPTPEPLKQRLNSLSPRLKVSKRSTRHNLTRLK